MPKDAHHSSYGAAVVIEFPGDDQGGTGTVRPAIGEGALEQLSRPLYAHQSEEQHHRPATPRCARACCASSSPRAKKVKAGMGRKFRAARRAGSSPAGPVVARLCTTNPSAAPSPTSPARGPSAGPRAGTRCGTGTRRALRCLRTARDAAHGRCEERMPPLYDHHVGTEVEDDARRPRPGTWSDGVDHAHRLVARGARAFVVLRAPRERAPADRAA